MLHKSATPNVGILQSLPLVVTGESVKEKNTITLDYAIFELF